MLSQANRIATLTTPLGEDTLVVTRFEGVESLGDLFEFVIDALSEKPALDFNPAIGNHCSVTLKTYKDQTRVFDGILVEARWLGSREKYYAYQLVLRPWLWLLTRRSDCQIFHDKPVTEIIKKIFQDAGFSDFELKLTESYDPIEYCVQYRETDFAFVSRLMEKYGIYYFFKHEKRKHTLVLADSKSSHQPVPGLAKIPYRSVTRNDQRDEQILTDWQRDRRFRTGRMTLNDYDYLKPNSKLKEDHQGNESYNKSDFEIYDYPGKYKDPDLGKKFAKVLLEAEQCQDHRCQALGDSPSLLPGGLTTLNGHLTDDTEYLVLHCQHSFVTQFYRSDPGSGGGDENVYSGAYAFLPSSQPYRSPPTTPHPRIHGIQTARVVGKEGEEIDVDEHGRILVHFFWDRHDDKSCRVRIGQPWAQKQWGHIVIPRIDHEVIVEFLEGDPDRPLVIGTVYNGDNKVPYKLPDHKTQSGIKTNSSKGGGGFNEFRFEDKKDQEQVYLRAQKDLDSLIRHKETREIGTVFDTDEGKSSRATTLKHGDDELVLETGSRKISIAVDRKENIGSNETVAIGKDQTIDVGQNIEITAGMKIVLAVGSNSITIDPSGITIVGTLVKIN
jgi:type VI secretion system secreted protein VgrG